MKECTIPPEFILATSTQSREIDKKTIREFGIDGFTLMEVAGSSTAKHLLSKLQAGAHGVFLCGKGNNAGDALVSARYIVQHGIDATIVFLSGTDDLSSNTEKNHQLLKTIAHHDAEAGKIQYLNSWKEFDTNTEADFIIDGMLGTGISSDLRGDYSKAVSWANESPLPIYSVDIPTGLHADSGEVMGNAIRAQITYTYGMQKLGFYFNEGYAHTGEIVFCELPFPNFLKNKCSSFLIDEKWAQADIHPMPKHKYDGGVLYIIAGSKGLTGAAIMAAKSAWAEGLGAVIIITPEGNLMPYEKNLPQIIKKSVGQSNDTHFKKEHLNQVLNIATQKEGTVLIGPGLGREDETISFVQSFLKNFEGDLVIDADAIVALSKPKAWEKPQKSSWILTPHPGELAMLLNQEQPQHIQRLEAVKRFSSSKKITLLSKDFPVILGTKTGDTYLTSYNTRQFSRAGFGDILAGKVSAYQSLGNSPLKSCASGLLNGKLKMDTLKKNNPTHIPEPIDLI